MASDQDNATKNQKTAPGRHVVHATHNPVAADVSRWSDHYFTRTKEIVGRFGDKRVTYAVFMRRPVIFAPKLMLDWLKLIADERGVSYDIRLNYDEGQWVGAGEPLLYITGSMYHLVDLETLYLQKLGAACVAANNAFTMCVELPDVAFLAMDARHSTGIEMAETMAYAASVGSKAAREQTGAKGFIGNATEATAAFTQVAAPYAPAADTNTRRRVRRSFH